MIVRHKECARVKMDWLPCFTKSGAARDSIVLSPESGPVGDPSESRHLQALRISAKPIKWPWIVDWHN